jgi:hypothetical protein
VDRGDGDDHVEDLLEREVVADFVSVLCGDKERPAGGEHPGAVFVECGLLLSKCASSSEAMWRLLVEKAKNRCSQAMSTAPGVVGEHVIPQL